MRVFRYSYSKDSPGQHFGERFRACVERCGKSNKEIGEAIGLSAQQVGRIARGGVAMVSDPKTLQRAARLFGVSDVWLYAGPAAPERFKPEWFH